MPIRKPTQNSGACEERQQIIDRINVLLRHVRKGLLPPVAEDILVDLRGWIRSRTERTRAHKGGL